MLIFKRLNKVLAAGVVFCFVSGCSLLIKPEDRIESKWKMTAIAYVPSTGSASNFFPDLVDQFPCFKDVIYEFKTDKKLTSTLPLGCNLTSVDLPFDFEAGYTIDGKNITITSGSSAIVATIKFSNFGKKLTLTESVNSDLYVYEFNRQ